MSSIIDVILSTVDRVSRLPRNMTVPEATGGAA